MNKSILITGCSSGIGLEAALILQKRGYQVFATARREADVERLRSMGLTSFTLDVADDNSIDTALNQIGEQTHGELYALFNNAGFGIPGAVADLDRTRLRAQFETNLFGAFALINRVLPAMLRRGRGRIIQNSSILGLVALPFRGAYNGSKFAMEGLTDTLRLELRGTGVQVSLIEPGPIISSFRQNSYAAFKQHINPETSVYRARYEQLEKRLARTDIVFPFTLPATAVVAKLIHALESKRPRAHYYVTFPTYLLAYLKRVLPTTMLDRIILKITGE